MRMMEKLKSYFLLLWVGVLAFSYASCGGDDDFENACDLCSHTINSKCTINNESFHTGTSMAQFLSNSRGSYLNIHLHKDGGDVLDFHDIDLSISSTTGPTIDDLQVGESLQLSNGTDGIKYFYDTEQLSMNQKQVTYSKYVSGSITCTKKNGTETILTFKNVVLQNSKDNSQVTINGTFVCDQYRH